jgi:TetR/AcrR family transcriptional repressor of nem operon
LSYHSKNSTIVGNLFKEKFMARNIEFEQSDVLDAAMSIFWDKGYKGTSMLDLEKATSLKPGSIYNSFKSKKGLFLAVLEHYQKQMVTMRIESILDKGDPLQAIENFFRSTYLGFDSDQLIGCLLTNTATELSNTDADIQRYVSAGINVIERAFVKRLTEAKKIGSIPAVTHLEGLAFHLTSCFQGLCVIGRLTRDSQRLKLISDQAIQSIPTIHH